MTPVAPSQVNSIQGAQNATTTTTDNSKKYTVLTHTEQNVGLCAKISAVFASIGNFFANLFSCFSCQGDEHVKPLSKTAEDLTFLPKQSDRIAAPVAPKEPTKTRRQAYDVNALTTQDSTPIKTKPAVGIIDALDLVLTEPGTTLFLTKEGALQLLQEYKALHQAAQEEAPATVDAQTRTVNIYRMKNVDGKLVPVSEKLDLTASIDKPVIDETAVAKPQQGSYKKTALKVAGYALKAAAAGFAIYLLRESSLASNVEAHRIAKNSDYESQSACVQYINATQAVTQAEKSVEEGISMGALFTSLSSFSGNDGTNVLIKETRMKRDQLDSANKAAGRAELASVQAADTAKNAKEFAKNWQSYIPTTSSMRETLKPYMPEKAMMDTALRALK